MQNKKDKSCALHRLRNTYQYNETRVTFELSEYLLIEIYTNESHSPITITSKISIYYIQYLRNQLSMMIVTIIKNK